MKQLESGLVVPDEYKKYPIAIDLFCGTGGFSLGFIQAGFEVVAGIDLDLYAAWTYMVNLGTYPINIYFEKYEYKEKLNNLLDKGLEDRKKKYKKQIKEKGFAEILDLLEQKYFKVYNNEAVERYTTFDISGSGWINAQKRNGNEYPGVSNYFVWDIRNITGEFILDKIGYKKGEIDCIMGGPPCQGFSKSNKESRKSYDPRNNMVFEFARLILEIEPKTFIFENVPDIINFITPDGIPVIDGLCMILADGGYGTFEAIRRSLLNNPGASMVKKNTSTGRKDIKDNEETLFDEI